MCSTPCGGLRINTCGVDSVFCEVVAVLNALRRSENQHAKITVSSSDAFAVLNALRRSENQHTSSCSDVILLRRVLNALRRSENQHEVQLVLIDDGVVVLNALRRSENQHGISEAKFRLIPKVLNALRRSENQHPAFVSRTFAGFLCSTPCGGLRINTGELVVFKRLTTACSTPCGGLRINTSRQRKVNRPSRDGAQRLAAV